MPDRNHSDETVKYAFMRSRGEDWAGDAEYRHASVNQELVVSRIMISMENASTPAPTSAAGGRRLYQMLNREGFLAAGVVESDIVDVVTAVIARRAYRPERVTLVRACVQALAESGYLA